MTRRVRGTFEVTLTPLAPDDQGTGATFGRLSIEKRFHGELDGTSHGQMMTASSEVKGSAGYVALERVTGTLQGRAGGFVLQHSGTLSAAGAQLSITVVPDSGSGQLLGLSGSLAIEVVDGKHFYEFDYTLGEAG